MRRLLISLIAGALLLLGFDIGLSAIHANTYLIAVGDVRSGFLLPNFHDSEQREDGVSYRWSRAEGTIVLGPLGSGGPVLLTLGLGGRPEPATLRLVLDGLAPFTLEASVVPRRYWLILPASGQPETRISLQSPTYVVPGDPRELGFTLESVRFHLSAAGPRLPPPLFFALQLATLAGVVLCLWRVQLPWLLPATALIALLLAAAWVWRLPYAYAYMQRLAAAAWVLLGLTWLLLPWVERLAWLSGPGEARLLWAVTLGALGLRLVGVLYPPFGGQDLSYHHIPRLEHVIKGWLIIIEPSSEFRGGSTLSPPGLYLLTMPGLLLTRDKLGLMQGLLALLDGGAALLVGLLARRLGAGRTTGLIAAVLYAGNPTTFTAHFFGFYPQIFGQWLMLPISLTLLDEALTYQRRWLIAAGLLLVATLTHIGVAILACTWLGWIWLITLPIERRRVGLRGLSLSALVLLGVGLLTVGLLYADYLWLVLNHPPASAATTSTGWLPGATPLLTRGMRLAFQEVGLVLLPVGLLVLIERQRWRTSSAITLAWLLTASMYLLVDLLTAFQVRYTYFALPLVLVLAALPLGQLARRSRLALIVAWSLAALLCIQGVTLWLSATLGTWRFSLTPLTH